MKFNYTDRIDMFGVGVLLYRMYYILFNIKIGLLNNNFSNRIKQKNLYYLIKDAIYLKYNIRIIQMK